MDKKFFVGIRCEDKSVWERRTPLAPVHIKEILEKHNDIGFIVQSSKKRIFSDFEYEEAGATIVQKLEELDPCQLVIGVKQIPIEKFIPNKTFMFFSHTIKAQPHNMAALDAILEKNIRLIDYEKITDEKNNRLIAFGKYAGIAGAIDFLKGLGEYIMQMGISTPLLNSNCSYKYFDLEQAYAHLKKIGKKMIEKEIPEEFRPMIFAITGRGRTAKGCLQVLQNLPITQIGPNQVEALYLDKKNPNHRKTIYVVNINSEDTIVNVDPAKKFDKKDYYKNPTEYTSNFKTKYLPYISALFHCIYWDVGCPIYISNNDLKELAEKQSLRLLGICDISCDLNGSIQCLQEYTQPEQPFFYHNSLTGQQSGNNTYEPYKFPYLAVDFLPCQLAYDASMHFSRHLKNWIPDLVKSDASKDVDEQNLIPELKRAVITSNGKLTPNFQYIAELRKQNEMEMSSMMKKKQNNQVEVDATQSVFHDNVSLISKEKIKGEALSFEDE